MKKFVGLLTATAALAIAAPAQATTLLFTFTGSITGSFELDSNPTPFNVTFGSFDVNVSNSPYSFARFWTSLYGGGVSLYVGPTPVADPYGAVLFGGSTSAPTFAPGGPIFLQGGSQVTITNAPAPAVPEPATWAMMIGGFALAGGAMRVRSRKVSFKLAA
ncbi:PEPxxWA-CTERM sorting domain-containing protein [Sphingomonas sp.]|uniref:PEPxxWA-CTERM sorting domain-containing protein n=1 Tax=Sphingomonas sp. TaxID=28214 RepID=UPI001B0F9186|nr:PEPxxWA-CTERM sorting domain-containing protein [Sphingomonas sp.]MBO9711884.1 PEPxxWA-CTERM sorting domain-containing protein [Sphingomonas sp.]